MLDYLFLRNINFYEVLMEKKLFEDDKWYGLKLGKSYLSNSETYHSIRYDFKPASLDQTQNASIDINDSNSITITIPNIKGIGNKNTVYQGNKRPNKKDCLLIYNKKSGQFTLERLASTMQVKTTRSVNSNKTNVAFKENKLTNDHSSMKAPSLVNRESNSIVEPANMSPSSSLSNSDDDHMSSSDVDDKDDEVNLDAIKIGSHAHSSENIVESLSERSPSRVSEDLHLSESSSDDSD